MSALAACILLAGLLPATTRAAIKDAPTPEKQPPAGLLPGPSDGRIAYVTAQQLELYHYSQQPLDPEMSKKFFDGYLEALDPNRENFLQSDIDGFMHYRTNLDLFTVGERGRSDLTPAYEIFHRYLERFEQHTAYAEELLKRDDFKFTGDDRYSNDRRHAPYPKDLDEAKQLWREKLRAEYLGERLGMEISPTNEDVILPLTKSNLTEITAKLERHYDWVLHMATNLDSTDVLQTYLDALAHAYDPHSDYLNTAHAQQFAIEMSIGLFGIGAQLGESDGYCRIDSLVLGGPAEKSRQLNAGDEIIAVAQTNKPPVDVVDMDLGKVVQLIRGPKGTQVRLTIIPADDHAARRVVALTRDEIKIEGSEARAQLIESPDGRGGTNRLGVVDLPEFYYPTSLSGGKDQLTPKFASVDVAKLVTKLEEEKVGGIILDLRGNPGGSLEEAIRLTGLFIKDGPVVLARSWDGHVSEDSDTDPSVLYSGPLIVLVNRLSASASEIVAAALQDYGRALVVGDSSTHGKGTVQDVRSLQPLVWPATNDPGDVKITIRKFYRVSGASTQLKGVVPDIILPDVLNYSDQVGETSLDNPLPFDTIASADYDRLNLVEPYLAALRQESGARVATNQDFTYIRQDVDEFKKFEAAKSTTLNEREAIQEQRAHQNLLNMHEQEREARAPSDEKVYDITVENAGEPGLLLDTNNFSAAVAARTNSIAKTPVVSNDAVEGQRANDARLRETENILEDYISDLSSNHTLIAN